MRSPSLRGQRYKESRLFLEMSRRTSCGADGEYGATVRLKPLSRERTVGSRPVADIYKIGQTIVMGTPASFFLGIVAALGFTGTATPYHQPDEQFRAALTNSSTSPSCILITVQDVRNGSTRTDCTLAPFLLGAIHKERDLPYDSASERAVLDVALTTKDHFFSFRNPAALANITFDSGLRYQRACELIRSGRRAFMSDRTGAVRDGQP